MNWSRSVASLALKITICMSVLSTAFAWWVLDRMKDIATRHTDLAAWERYSTYFALFWRSFWPTLAGFIFFVVYFVVHARMHGGRPRDTAS